MTEFPPNWTPEVGGYPPGGYPPPGGYAPSPVGYSAPRSYPAPGYPAPGYQTPSYPAPGYPAPGYPAQPSYGADPNAPFGRDSSTGEPLSDKSKVTAGLLQLFLGGFGAGRFYLGSNNIAIGQLVTWFVGFLLVFLYGIGLIVWFGLSIWALVDAIMIFTGSVRDQYGRPLRP